MTDEERLTLAGWRDDGASWKRKEYIAVRGGFGWVFYFGNKRVWNDETLPPWAVLDLPKQNEPEKSPRTNSPEYDAAIKDAVIWLVQNSQRYKPEFLAENMANDLLSQ